MQYSYLIFDFDGVLAETNEIRNQGFETLFHEFPSDLVGQFMKYVQSENGKSRYERIEYFFNRILNKNLSEKKRSELAQKYSRLVKHKVVDAVPVAGSLDFIKQYKSKYEFAIVSASDQDELRFVCDERRISSYFVAILGSPTTKVVNIENLIASRQWSKERCLYVGDSKSDYIAAQKTGISFIGRNSTHSDWGQTKKVSFIDNFYQLQASILNLR